MAQGMQKIQRHLSSPHPPKVSASASKLMNFTSFSARAEIILCFWDLVGSVRTTEETLDATSANWNIRGTEFLRFKERRLFNYFSFVQLSKVILIFVTSGWLCTTTACRTNSTPHSVSWGTGAKFLQDNSNMWCSHSERQVWALTQSRFQLHHGEWSWRARPFVMLFRTPVSNQGIRTPTETCLCQLWSY